MTGLFIVGTDTGVGKTTVGAALARLARRRGRRPVPFKPVETGCDPEPLDARLLWDASGRPIPLADVCPYPLVLPAAPAAAAQAQGAVLDLQLIARRARAAADAGDFLLVEGAGGLLVPYAGRLTTADLAADLGLPLLVAARTALGTINHTALTVAEIRRRALPLAGVLLVRTTALAEPHERWNADLIEASAGVRPLGTLPHVGDTRARDPDALADALLSALGDATIARLLEGGPLLRRSPVGSSDR